MDLQAELASRLGLTQPKMVGGVDEDEEEAGEDEVKKSKKEKRKKKEKKRKSKEKKPKEGMYI